MMTQNFVSPPVTDKGSRAEADIAFYSPVVPAGYYYFGMYAVNSYAPMPGMEMRLFTAVNDDPQNPCFLPPLSFIEQWTCIGNDQPSNLGIYVPQAPTGYIALGSIAVENFNSPPTVNQYPNLMCVRADLCMQIGLNKNNITWTDRGSRAPLDVSVWGLLVATNCIATVDSSYPDKKDLYDLIPSKISNLTNP